MALNPICRNKQSPIVNEAKKGIKNAKGSIAMARTNVPNSGYFTIFYQLSGRCFLDYKNDSAEGIGYCALGQVTEGMDIVNLIGGVKTTSKSGHDDVPVEDVVILTAEVILKIYS